MEEEIGRELKASELKVGTVVVVFPPNAPMAFSVWVIAAEQDYVVFYAGDWGMSVMNFITPQDTLIDGASRPIKVCEYLGI